MNFAAKILYDKSMTGKPWYAHHPILKLYEKKQDTLNLKHFLKPLLIPFLLALLMLGSFSLYQFIMAKKAQEEKQLPITLTPTPTKPPPTATPTPWPTTPPPHTVYSLSIRPKPAFTKPETPFSKVLSDIMKNTNPTISYLGPFVAVSQDTDKNNQGTDAYNADYFLVITAGSLTTKTFETEELKGNLELADEQHKPYLLSKRFCEKNTDCVLRESYCTLGAFNRFDTYLDVWSCAPGKITQENIIVGTYNTEYQCTTDVIYESSACQANQCVGINPKLYCPE
jgi:hypothetical protein